MQIHHWVQKVRRHQQLVVVCVEIMNSLYGAGHRGSSCVSSSSDYLVHQCVAGSVVSPLQLLKVYYYS